MKRPVYWFGVAIAASWPVAGGAVDEAAAQSRTGRVTWQGVRTSTLSGPKCQRRTEETFVWVEEVATTGDRRWLSRTIKWSDVHSCTGEIIMFEDTDGDPTTPPRRSLKPYFGRCENHGEVDVNAWDGKPFVGRCWETPRRSGSMAPSRLPTGWAGPKPDDMMREGCAYNHRAVAPPGPSGHIGIESESVIRTDDVNATVNLWVDDRGAANTFPSPGAEVLLSARATVPVRWKFIIGSSSRLRGYATNQDVDAAFFEIFNLPNLRGRYGTQDPDLIFDPSRFEPPWDRTGRWKRPYPGSGPLKWSILESQSEESNVDVDLTTMDFAAHGEVVALVRSPCGGSWVQVNTGGGRSAMSVPPAPDADRNLIPDGHTPYMGLAADSDGDGEPNPGGTPGDGVTAFEEYRGFMRMKPAVTSCNSQVAVEHVRTDPARKDLFIHATDPVLWRAARHFKTPSGLDVHMICPQPRIGLPPDVVDEEGEAQLASRVVNKTSGLWRQLTGHAGERLTLDRPQHWLRVVNEPRPGLHGQSIRINRAEFGPPRNVDRVAVNLASIREAVRAGEFYRRPQPGMYPQEIAQITFEQMVLLITWHELGHSVGLQHHGDTDPDRAVILIDQPSCLPGMQAGTIDGAAACVASGVANRGGRFSGDSRCPMKRIQGSYYVPPSSQVLVRSGYRDFRPAGSWSWSRPRQLGSWRGGPVLPYNKRGDPPRLGQFCTSALGTHLNVLLGDLNHAGDASRKPPCAAQLRVNDTR